MLIQIPNNGFARALTVQVVGCRLNGLDEPVFVTALDSRVKRLDNYERNTRRDASIKHKCFKSAKLLRR